MKKTKFRLMKFLQKKWLILSVIVLLNQGNVLSQNEQQVFKLDLDAAVEMALENNQLIKISHLGRKAAEAQYYETFGSFLPDISGSAMYNNNVKRPVIFMPDGPPFFGEVLELGSKHSYNAGFSASMPLYNHALINSLRANRIQKELSEEELRAAKIDLKYEVRMAFFNSLLAAESFEIMKQRFENAEKNFENVRSMHKQGIVSEFDLIRAEVQTENLRPSLIQAENALKLSLNYLKALLGVDNNTDIELMGDLIDKAEKVMLDFNLEQAQRSLVYNTNLVQLEIQRKLLNQQARTIRASNLPSIAAIGNYQFQSQAEDLNFSDYNWVQTAVAGFQINVPIFNGFTTRNRARQVEIASEQVSLQREYLENNLNVQMDDILRTLDLAIEKVVNAEKNVSMAERAYNIALRRYDTGQGTLLEVNDSEVALSQAKFNYIQAIHEILQAKTEHEKFIGQN